MNEIWKNVTGYEGLYEVSNLGRVRSLDMEFETIRNGYVIKWRRKGRVLSPLVRQHGYLAVQLHGKGGNARGFKTFSIHRLVAEAFIPNLNNYPEVNHIDENKTNNSVDNLEWCDRLYNCRTGTRSQRVGISNTNNPKRSKSVAQYTKDGIYIKTYASLKEASRQTNIAPGNICKNIKGDKSYSHAGGYVWKYAKKVGEQAKV